MTYATANVPMTRRWTLVLGPATGERREDQHDEWQDDRRLFSQQSMARLLNPEGPPLLTNPLTEGLAA